MKPRIIYTEWTRLEGIIFMLILLTWMGSGTMIMAKWSALRAIIYFLLWPATILVTAWASCRKCCYYGKRCYMLITGPIAKKLFKKEDIGITFIEAAIFSVFWGALLIWPILFTIFTDNLELLVFYIIPPIVLSVVWRFGIACPHCGNLNCPINPDNLHENN